MNAKKVALVCILCIVLLTIGVVIIAGIGIGIWFATGGITIAPTTQPQPTNPPEFLIGIESAIQDGQAFTNGFIELELSLPDGMFTQGNVLVYLDGVKRYSYKTFPSIIQIPTQGLQDGTHNITVVAVSTSNARGIGEIIIIIQDPGLMLVSIDYPLSVFPGMEITIVAEISGNVSHFVPLPYS